MMNAPKVGDRINNYILDELVGQGSFAQVFKAHHHVLDQTVAVKIPTDAQYVRNLQREGVTIHGLRHPNIVRAIDLDPYADPPYLIMEFVDGPSLRNVLDGIESPLPVESACEVLRGVLRALQAAHKADVIHRDIKPANILIADGQDPAAIATDDVKVTDFGLGQVGGATAASMIQSASLSSDEQRAMAGTIAYMAPEQRDGEDLDPRCDLYACGVVLFEMLTGRRPQGGDLPGQLRADVPEYLDEIFRKCYTHRDRRFASAADILAALDAQPVLTPIPPDATSARPPSIPPPPPPGPTQTTCQKCGGPVGSSDQFCIHCGHQLVDIVPKCSSCHAYVHPGDRFCIFCGEELIQSNPTGEALA